MSRDTPTIIEDFQPIFESKEEQGANIVDIHLPDFAKDQISVTYVESSCTIEVEGERPLEKNKRSRFNQALPVPQNCIIEKIQGSFRNGILTITMPKKTITQAGSVKDVNATKKTTQTGSVKDVNATKKAIPQKPISQPQPITPPKAASTSGVEKQRDEKMKPPQTPQIAVPEPKGSMTTGPQISPPKAQTNGKKVEPEALKPSKQQEETQKKATPVDVPPKQTEEKTEIVGQTAQSKVGLQELVKEKESAETNDTSASETNIPKVLDKEKKENKAGSPLEEKPKECGGSFLEKAKQIKGMDAIIKTAEKLSTDANEDRQFLINMGVSVLVIVALGAYITYRFRSSGKARD